MKFGDKMMVLVLANVSHHLGYDAELRLPENNSKGCNTELVRKYKCKKITVEREVTGSAGVTRKKHTFKVPVTGTFPQANSKCGEGMTSPEVALATRAFFQLRHPTKLMEKVGKFVNERGSTVDLGPP